jgi:hypothetical protein
MYKLKVLAWNNWCQNHDILSIKGDIFSGSNFVTADVEDSKQQEVVRFVSDYVSLKEMSTIASVTSKRDPNEEDHLSGLS